MLLQALSLLFLFPGLDVVEATEDGRGVDTTTLPASETLSSSTPDWPLPVDQIMYKAHSVTVKAFMTQGVPLGKSVYLWLTYKPYPWFVIDKSWLYT